MRLISMLDPAFRQFTAWEKVTILKVMITYLESGLTGNLKLEERNSITRRFFNGILPIIRAVARVKAEEHFIIAELVKRQMGQALEPFYSALLDLETKSPQLIFGADS